MFGRGLVVCVVRILCVCMSIARIDTAFPFFICALPFEHYDSYYSAYHAHSHRRAGLLGLTQGPA